MKRYKMNGKSRSWQKENLFFVLGATGVFLYYIPYFILGQDAAFRISDFLDDELVQYLLNGKYMFAAPGTIVEEWLSGAPLASIQAPSFLLILFFNFLPYYYAVIISCLFGTVCAYIGMYLLCNRLFKGEQKYISAMAALLYCILPYYPSYGLSSVGLPLVVWACMHLWENKGTCDDANGRTKLLRYLPYFMVLILYSLSSSLIWSGYFVLGFIFVAAIVGFVKKKRGAAGRLAVSGMVMTFVYCFVFRETISSILFSTFISHRADPIKVYTAEDFKQNFVEMFKYGQYHVPSLHTYIMAFSLVVVVLGIFFYKRLEQKIKKQILLTGVIWATSFLIALFHAFYNCEAGLRLRSYLGGLESFQLDRVYWAYPMLWYVELALSVSVFLAVAECVLKVIMQKVLPTNNEKRDSVQKGLLCTGKAVFVAGLTLFMANYIIHHQNSVEYYANVQKVFGKETGQMSYREFYDHELFAEIEAYIGKEQSTYRVGCLGFVPAIASVNGFYTVDGYSTNYPLEYKYQFREVIEKELEKNETVKAYYDNWGSRCYLYSAELGLDFQILKEDNIVIKNLELDTEALKELGCEYIFSAVEIQNAGETGLAFLEVFSGEESAIEVFVYGIN